MRRNESERALALSVMTLIDQGHRRISARLDLTRLQILGLVIADGPLRPATIASRLSLGKSAVSRHLTALQDAGHVLVREDPTDARTFLVEITLAGESEVAAATNVGAGRFARAIESWTDQEVDDARRGIDHLLDAWATSDAPDRTDQLSQTGSRGPVWMRRQTAHTPSRGKNHP